MKAEKLLELFEDVAIKTKASTTIGVYNGVQVYPADLLGLVRYVKKLESNQRLKLRMMTHVEKE